MTNRLFACALLVPATLTLGACGKKGPPLAPIRIAPAAVTELTARRVGDRVQLRFVLPDKNTDNSTPADVARVEVHALSVEKPQDAPSGPDFLRAANRIAAVTPEPEQASATVTEILDAKALDYYVPPAPPRPPAPATPGAAPPVEETVPVRMYVVVPVNRRGQRGTSAAASVPLVEAPPPPPTPLVTFSEKAIALTWPASGDDERYQVYEVVDPEAAATSPLTAAPLPAATYEDARLEFGKPRCYRVTAVRTVNRMPIESAPSPAACVTPVDTFAPAAPAGLAAVAGPGTISLIWDAVTAPDLAGYVVLRGDAPGDTLQALTPEPIKETTFSDPTVTPGQTYVYAVIAIDQAKNTSARSAPVTETAR